mgnify:FL=1
MKKLISFCIAIFLTSTLCASNFVMITDLGTSAKSIALGNIDGYSNSASAIFTNPASLTYTKGHSIALFGTTLMDQVNYYSVSFSTRIFAGTLGLGVFEQSTNNIPRTAQKTIEEDLDQTIYQIGSFDYKNSVVKASYQAMLTKKLSMGLNYSLYSIVFDGYDGTGSNFDLGLFYKLNNVGVSVFTQNIIPKQYVVFSNSNKELLPTTVSTSIVYPIKSFTVIPQVKYSKRNVLISSGLRYSPGFLPFLSLMAGYKQQLDYSLEKHQKVTLGLELRLFDLHLHYAYERSDYYLTDNNNYFSIQYNL